MSEEILKSEKMKEAFENVMTAVNEIPSSEVKEGDALFLVTSDMGKGTCFAMGKAVAINCLGNGCR